MMATTAGLEAPCFAISTRRIPSETVSAIAKSCAPDTGNQLLQKDDTSVLQPRFHLSLASQPAQLLRPLTNPIQLTLVPELSFPLCGYFRQTCPWRIETKNFPLYPHCPHPEQHIQSLRHRQNHGPRHGQATPRIQLRRAPWTRARLGHSMFVFSLNPLIVLRDLWSFRGHCTKPPFLRQLQDTTVLGWRRDWPQHFSAMRIVLIANQKLATALYGFRNLGSPRKNCSSRGFPPHFHKVA